MRKLNLLIFILLSSIGWSQWTNDYAANTLVADATTSDIQSIGTNDGKTYVIYWDETNGVDGYELRVQLLDADGNQLFGENGMLANDAVDMSTWTATRAEAVDADGNLYIGFTGTGDSKGYVNKISPTGEQLFGSGGISITDGWNMNVLPMDDGSVIVGWEPGGSGHLMKYDAAGNPAWDNEIVLDTPNAGSPFTGIGDMVHLSDDSFVILINTKTTSWTVNAIVWAQRFDTDGNAMWDNDVQISQQTTYSNKRYQLVQEDDVIYYGYSGSTGFRFDAFLQRINPDGTLPWGIDGANFSTDDLHYEMDMSFVANPDVNYIWATSNICNDTQSQYGISVQKFNKETGEVELAESGQTVFPVSAENWVRVGNLQTANGNPLFLFSNDISNGVNSIQLGVVYLNENGEFAWDDEYEMIATSTNNKSRIDFTKNVDGQSVAVWTEPRSGISKAYAQNYKVEPAEPNGPCDDKIVMECGETYTVTLNPGQGEWVNYTDVTYDYTGSEQVFEFTPTESGTYTFEVDEGENDADFFLMDACSNSANNLSDGYWTGLQNETIDLVAGTTYYLISDLYSGSTSPTIITVKVNCLDGPGPGDEYCEPNLNCTDGDLITNVTFAGIDNDSDCGPNGYGDYTDMTGMVEAGSTNDISVTVGGGWAFESVSVWIDYNNNFSFDEDEFTYVGTGSASDVIGQIMIPADVAEGNYRMRVRVAAVGDASATWDMACDEDQEFGETEDYTITIGDLAVTDMNTYQFAYYPNPVKDILKIETQKTIENISVYNLAGQAVIQNMKAENGTLNMSGLNPGIYVFRVTLEGGQIETFKIIKK